jgi:hypothetical protein
MEHLAAYACLFLCIFFFLATLIGVNPGQIFAALCAFSALLIKLIWDLTVFVGILICTAMLTALLSREHVKKVEADAGSKETDKSVS